MKAGKVTGAVAGAAGLCARALCDIGQAAPAGRGPVKVLVPAGRSNMAGKRSIRLPDQDKARYSNQGPTSRAEGGLEYLLEPKRK